ncbi:hypothetical protein QBC37DRAFT_301447 [Rhypophila decipiens]|uniref:NACHT-NTPase and P-loop NTPases N-terminal domain-containing protein n=1 Tax=Rhypophila decipiens TaxID=261697 RepID=A0AAN6XSG3_9PEZI|nr:hypothetical protein QBC37DRAFT_301447 [Rhypophila decipiens]
MACADVANFSGTIAILKATTKHYNIVSNEKSLRGAFHEAGRGLLLVEEALQAAETLLDGRGLQSVMNSLESCNTKAKLSESIFRDVAEAPERARFERYKAAVRRDGKGNTVEALVEGMMEDVCDLAKESAIEAAMETHVKALRDAIDKLSGMEPSVPTEGSGDMYSNSGSGTQFNAPRGTQNNNTGSGHQFTGPSFSGPVTFGKNPSSEG